MHRSSLGEMLNFTTGRKSRSNHFDGPRWRHQSPEARVTEMNVIMRQLSGPVPASYCHKRLFRWVLKVRHQGSSSIQPFPISTSGAASSAATNIPTVTSPRVLLGLRDCDVAEAREPSDMRRSDEASFVTSCFGLPRKFLAWSNFF